MLVQLEGALSDLQQSFRMRNRFKQLAMLVIARTTPVSELQGLQELFQRLDVDNSGLLSLEELRHGLRSMDGEVSPLPAIPCLINNTVDFLARPSRFVHDLLEGSKSSILACIILTHKIRAWTVP